MNIVWILLLATAVCAVDDHGRLFSWSSNTELASQMNHQYQIEGNGGNENYNQNDTAIFSLDDVIDSILASNRQGRNLDGFDEVYSDPTVQDALQKGDDSQARNLIKDKLCTLGLMQCEGATGGDIGHKNAFLRPSELIYAAPPNAPYRGPLKPPTKIIYGAARPMPPGIIKHQSHQQFGPPQHYGQQQQQQQFGPPRKVGYASGPVYSSPPFLSSPPSGFGNSGPVYHSKPPGPIIDSPPYKFDSHNEHIISNEEYHALGLGDHGPVKSSINDGITGTGSNSVNIHHHYHHVDGASNSHDSVKAPAVIVNNPIPIPVQTGPLVTGKIIDSIECRLLFSKIRDETFK